MFSVLILEDNLVQLNTIKQLISYKHPKWKIYTAKSYTEAKKLLDICKFNMFLLDIELSKDASEPDGLDFGRLVRKMSDYKHTPVLFFAGQTDKVLMALQEVHCSSYLVKPYTPKQLTEAIEYASEILQETEEVLLIKDSNGVYQRIIPMDIEYLETSGKNIIINVNSTAITIANYTVTKVLEILPEYFTRCHKRYIINRKKLLSYDKSTQMVRLQCCSIPVGRKYKDDLEKFLDL